MSIKNSGKVVVLVGLALLTSTVSGVDVADAHSSARKSSAYKAPAYKSSARKSSARKAPAYKAPARETPTYKTPTPTRKTVQVYSTYDEPSPEPNGVRCTGIRTAQPKCAIPVSGDAYFVGTFEGTAHYELESEIGVDSKSRYGGGGNQFDDVVVAGCGHGAFYMDEWDGYVDMGRYDPVTNSAPGYNKWRIRTGSGTGDLVGLEGEGENNWTVYFNGFLPTAGPRDGGKGVFTGKVSC